MIKIYPLDDIPSDQLDRVGGKARGLFELAKHNFSISPGFVVTGLEQIDDFAQIYDYLEKMNYGAVAVRSSATAEDGQNLSSAGQYETELNVVGKESFLTALKKVLKSSESQEANQYRSNFAQEKSPMNIVVQKMIEPQFAGVAFSRDPRGGNRVVIEAVNGLGEKLVSGHGANYHGDFSRESFKNDNDCPIKRENLHHLYLQTLKAENELGYAVDLEWAIDKNNELFFLQARPITTLDGPDIDELDSPYDVEGHLITDHNVGEMLPGAITPLTISTVVYAIDSGIRDMLRRVGVIKKVGDLPPHSIICNYGGHLFFDLNYLYLITDNVLAADCDSVDLGIAGEIVNPLCSFKTHKRPLPLRIINGMRYGNYLGSHKRALRKELRLAREFSIPQADSALVQYHLISAALPELDRFMAYHYIESSYSGAMSGALITIFQREGIQLDKIKELLAGVLENIDGIESVDILRSLRRLAKAVLKVNPEAGKLSDNDLEHLIKEDSPEAKTAYEYFMHRHGHRAIREAELRSPGWADDSTGFYNYLRLVMNSKTDEEKKDPAVLKANIDRMLSLEKKKNVRRIVRYLIKEARLGCRNREKSKSQLIRGISQFKHAYTHLANLLVQEKLLPDADLIYFFTQNELADLWTDTSNQLIRRAQIRRRLLSEQEELRYPHVSVGVPQPLTRPVIEEIATTLKGTPLSRGRITGRARIIRKPDDALSLQKGEIMVSGYTDIGWSPYYSVIGGLITEMGSALSHGAVVAREYALPLVSNVNGATDLIQTGDLVSIDAYDGQITIMHRKDEK